jgi:hypothetical protein
MHNVYYAIKNDDEKFIELNHLIIHGIMLTATMAFQYHYSCIEDLNKKKHICFRLDVADYE